MKRFILMLSLFWTLIVKGDAYLRLVAPPVSIQDDQQPEIHLIIWEPLGDRFVYESFSGVRMFDWAVSTHFVDYRLLPGISIGVGPSVHYEWRLDRPVQTDFRLNLRLNLKLW